MLFLAGVVLVVAAIAGLRAGRRQTAPLAPLQVKVFATSGNGGAEPLTLL